MTQHAALEAIARGCAGGTLGDERRAEYAQRIRLQVVSHQRILGLLVAFQYFGWRRSDIHDHMIQLRRMDVLFNLAAKISGGKIWFESEENAGTTFHVSLPVTHIKAQKGTTELSRRRGILD